MSIAIELEELFPASAISYTLAEYQIDASKTVGPDASPIMMALGVGGESGEVLEVIKKGNRPGREVDVPHLKEEIGDVMWYLANLAKYYGLSFEEIALDNIEKLQKRYGE